MKFLVDAHLPAAVCRVLREAGHDALHTIELPDANRTKDRAINERSIREHRVVVSKDTEFYYSHLLQRAAMEAPARSHGKRANARVGVFVRKKFASDFGGAYQQHAR